MTETANLTLPFVYSWPGYRIGTSVSSHPKITSVNLHRLSYHLVKMQVVCSELHPFLVPCLRKIVHTLSSMSMRKPESVDGTEVTPNEERVSCKDCPSISILEEVADTILGMTWGM